MKGKKRRRIPKTSFIDNPKYGFIKRLMLFGLAISVLGFNTLIKIDVKASNSTDSITIENLLRAHNEYRAEMGMGQLRLNTLLNISAQKKGEVMLSSNCWSHYCPPNKSPWKFFDEAKYDYVFAGENLAEGYYNIGDVMQAWINSKTHRDNIVKPEFVEVGFAILYGNYLNNSNNMLVVVHFGSRPDGSVLSDFNPAITIKSPQNNATVAAPEVDITGLVNGFDQVQVFNNNTLSGQAQISGGIFTYRLDKLNEGQNRIYADGINSSGFSLTSNTVNVTYTPNVEMVSETTEFLNTEEGFTISLQNRNLINLGFIIFLALIFIIDIILVSRTSAISTKKSFSHYHLGLIILVALIIAIGGFAGQIQNGISV